MIGKIILLIIIIGVGYFAYSNGWFSENLPLSFDLEQKRFFDEMNQPSKPTIKTTPNPARDQYLSKVYPSNPNFRP